MTSPPVLSRIRGVRDYPSVVSWDVITEDDFELYHELYFVTKYFCKIHVMVFIVLMSQRHSQPAKFADSTCEDAISGHVSG